MKTNLQAPLSISEYIRPTRVLKAAQYLVSTSDLFKDEGIQALDNYNATHPGINGEEWSEFTNHNNIRTSYKLPINFSSQEQSEVETQANGNDLMDNDTDHEWGEVTAEQPPGVMDTLLQEPDITRDGDRIRSFAPGEGNRPLGIFMDKDSEYLSFPTIYCGKHQADNSERFVPVHYSTMSIKITKQR